MGTAKPARPAKLIVGMLSNDVDLLHRARQLLSRLFGPVDLESDLWPFDVTDYYEPEMGPGLQRQFLSFEALIQPGRLAHIKHTTNDLEARICRECAVPPEFRRVNLDPGYVTLGKLVLATTKDRAHRVYLAEGIYAEVTLRFEKGQWRAWPWTYPDYAADTYHAFLTRVRQRLAEQLSGSRA